MIIRFNNGKAGIKNYLETGQSKDRFYDRDELDERLVLSGNLNIIDHVINNIDNSGEKYLHITLAFKEDYISNNILKDINNEFKDFFLNAYSSDEIPFYSEAHLPKIKSYTSKQTGDLVERKPHIHIVIPQINLLSGTLFGFPYEKYQEYINSFQEYINSKYGLASPKDNHRYGFNKHSEMVSRYKGDNFVGANSDFKKQLLDKVLSSQVENYSDFVNLLKQEYTIKYRNENKLDKDSYINIKNANMARGINLKEYVFTKEFLNLSLDNKYKYLDSSSVKSIKYIDMGESKKVRQDYIENLNIWNTLLSHKEKYINIGGSKKDRITFDNLSSDAQITMINQKKEKFYNRINERDINAGKSIQTDYTRDTGAYLRTIIECCKHIEQNGRDVSEVSRNIDSIGQQIKTTILSRRRGDIEEYKRDSLRRSAESDTRDEGDSGDDRHEINSSVVQQLVSEYNNNLFNNYNMDLIRNQSKYLAADILLELVARTHGVIPEKYEITKGYDGSDRIKCGNRIYSVSDFLTKEVNLRFSQAAPLLQTALQMQNEVYIEMGYDPQKKPYLFGEYKSWLVQYKVNKDQEYNNYKVEVKTKRDKIRNHYKLLIKEDREDKSLLFYAKEKKIRELKSALTKELSALNLAVGHDWANLRSRYNLELQNAYKIFLAEKAKLGDDIALVELRRMRVNFDEYQKSGEIRHVDRYDEYRLHFDYSVDKLTGNIVYSINGTDVLTDVGRRLDIFQANDDTLGVAITLAIQKFGTNIQLFGSDDFKQKVIHYAIEHGYKLTYTDEFSKQYQANLNQQIKEEGRFKQIHYANKWLITDNYNKLLSESIVNKEDEIKKQYNIERFLDSAVGSVVDFGLGNFGKSKNPQQVYFIKVREQSGHIKTIWSNNLQDFNVKLGDYIYIAKIGHDKQELNISLHHKLQRFINGSKNELSISKRDVAVLNQCLQFESLNNQNEILNKLIKNDITAISKNDLAQLISNQYFTNIAKNDFEKITVTNNNFSVKHIDTDSILLEANNLYNTFCREQLVNSSNNVNNEYDKTILKDVVVVDYSETLIKLANSDTPHKTFKLIVKDVDNNINHIIYSDKLMESINLYRFAVGDKINLTVNQPKNYDNICNTIVDVEMKQKKYLELLEQKSKNIRIKVDEHGQVTLNAGKSKLIYADAAKIIVEDNLKRYNLSNNDRVSLKPIINRDSLDITYEISSVTHNELKQDIYKSLFVKEIEKLRQDFIIKTGNTALSKIYEQAGILTSVDKENLTLTITQPYMGYDNKTVVKKLNFSAEQFNNFEEKLIPGKFIYLGQTYKQVIVESEAKKITRTWDIKQLNVDSNTKASDIFKQALSARKEFSELYHVPIDKLDTMSKLKMGKVLEISHNPIMGAYFIKMQMVGSEKSYYFRMEQESASKLINSGKLETNKYIYAAVIDEKEMPMTRNQKTYEISSTDNDINKEVARLYEVELEHSKLIRPALNESSLNL
jgi:hypothetical protein